jgi:hypothetical protein
MSKPQKKTNVPNSKNAAPTRLTALTLLPPRKKAQCAAVSKRTGKRCKSAPVLGEKVCLLHIPGKASEMGQKGGRHRASFHPVGLESFAPPTSATEVARMLAHTLCEVRSGRMPEKMASVISSVSATFMDALEKSDVEARLKVLEEKLPSKARPN